MFALLHTDRGLVGGILMFIALRGDTCFSYKDVIALKMLSLLWRCAWEEKQVPCAFRPWFSIGLWPFYVYQKKPDIAKTCNSCEKSDNDPNWWNWKWQNTTIENNRGQHIPDTLSGCWTHPSNPEDNGRSQNTVKHSERWLFWNSKPINFNWLPYTYIWLYINVIICINIIYTCIYIYIPRNSGRSHGAVLTATAGLGPWWAHGWGDLGRSQRCRSGVGVPWLISMWMVFLVCSI